MRIPPLTDRRSRTSCLWTEMQRRPVWSPARSWISTEPKGVGPRPNIIFPNSQQVASWFLTSRSEWLRGQTGKGGLGKRGERVSCGRLIWGGWRSSDDVSFRAPSPLSDLLAHQYARRWVDEQLSRNQTSSQKQQHRVNFSSFHNI